MKTLFIFGTRPEAIKMAPLIKTLSNEENFDIKTCITGQHKEMLDQVLSFFKIPQDYQLHVMQPNQTLPSLTAKLLTNIQKVIDTYQPNLIFVQGDTTSALAGSLAGFYKKITVAHVEAGLRSHHLYAPFPEEGNRLLISKLAQIHFAPTQKAAQNLQEEGIKQNIITTGNTVIDALLQGLEIIEANKKEAFFKYFDFLDFNKKIILITGHRRESFGKPFLEICSAIQALANQFPDVQMVYPVHLNPNVQKPVYKILGNTSNVFLMNPLSYPYLIWLMKHSYLVLTDSGGIQEEAPSLGKPVLVMRDVTERVEGLEAGTASLVGSKKESIIKHVTDLIENDELYNTMAQAINPYGDGLASKRITHFLKKRLDIFKQQQYETFNKAS